MHFLVHVCQALGWALGTKGYALGRQTAWRLLTYLILTIIHRKEILIPVDGPGN